MHFAAFQVRYKAEARCILLHITQVTEYDLYRGEQGGGEGTGYRGEQGGGEGTGYRE